MLCILSGTVIHSNPTKQFAFAIVEIAHKLSKDPKTAQAILNIAKMAEKQPAMLNKAAREAQDIARWRFSLLSRNY